MFVEGDIVGMYDPLANKHKFLLCIAPSADDSACKFIYLNSNKGYAGDFVVGADELPCLGRSVTGETVFSLTLVLRRNNTQLAIYRASRKGEIGSDLARRLLAVARSVPTLSGKDRRAVISGLEAYLKRTPEVPSGQEG